MSSSISDCPNCDGRKCMGCVCREPGHDCADDCPDCCVGDTFTWQEMRIALTAFAIWLLKEEPSEGLEAELVDQFIRETT